MLTLTFPEDLQFPRIVPPVKIQDPGTHHSPRLCRSAKWHRPTEKGRQEQRLRHYIKEMDKQTVEFIGSATLFEGGQTDTAVVLGWVVQCCTLSKCSAMPVNKTLFESCLWFAFNTK